MKSGWTRLVRIAAAGTLAVGLWTQGAWAAEVKNVTAEYAWPWGVEIRYEVVGTITTNVPLVVSATDRSKNVTSTAEPNSLSGDTGHNAGAHRLMWDLDKQGVKLQSTNVVFTVEYLPMYCVVDLSGGANASSYPVTYMDQPPSGGFNTDVYKTTKLVLRRIEPGTFAMGGSYQVTLSKAFFVGVFEVTQKQWTLVMGTNPSAYQSNMFPVECVSYEMIRGSSAGMNWPASNAVDASSFLGKLRAKTGLEFDLPTEAQWEYACRAGTTSSYNNGGSTANDLKQLGLYAGNVKQKTDATVGSYKANAWGLYDMHGNVWEWCLDRYGSLSAGTDPKGSSSGYSRVLRGGGWSSLAESCTSFHRCDEYPDKGRSTYHMQLERFGYYGFRLVRTLAK